MIKNLFLICIFLGVSVCFSGDDARKTPNVAGQFYSADRDILLADIKELLAKAKTKSLNADIPRILIAPHAGYAYSGMVAAQGYKAVEHIPVKTVIVISPSHFMDLEGVSIWPQGSFQTPLRDIAVDQELSEQILNADKRFKSIPQAFDREHALEVHLPFIGHIWPQAKIVPIIIGRPDGSVCRQLAQVIASILSVRSDIFVVVSSDLSHYHDGNSARLMDNATIKTILQQDAQALWDNVFAKRMELCGFTPVITALLIAQSMSLDAHLIQYAHSGDVSGDNTRVVGYASIAFSQRKMDAPLTEEQKKSLLTLARVTIDHFINKKELPPISNDDSRLMRHQGAFVTVKKKGQLRGCIGNIVSDKSLIATVRDMAIAAVSQDPRFSPVGIDELKDIEVEVSVLSVPKKIDTIDEIILGMHGVIISDGQNHQGVFLPQVALETGWDKKTFLNELCRQKAGLSDDCYQDPRNIFYTFTADVFSEHEKY